MCDGGSWSSGGTGRRDSTGMAGAVITVEVKVAWSRRRGVDVLVA